MLLSRMVKAKRKDSFSTASSTGVLEVKMRANLSWRAITRIQKQMPIADDVTTDTMVANLAPLPLPAPSSFATLTLSCLSSETWINHLVYYLYHREQLYLICLIFN